MKNLARKLIEAPIDTGEYGDIIDPERKRKFATRSHPMAKHPSYPDYVRPTGTKPDNFEELIASKEYQETIKKLNKYASKVLGRDFMVRSGRDMFPLMTTFMGSVRRVQEIESAHRPQLEQLAVQLVLSLPDFRAFKEAVDAGELNIVARLLEQTRMPDGPENEDEDEGGEPEEEKAEIEFELASAIDPEELELQVIKRRFINGMIQGNAVAKHHAFHLVADQLNGIDPNLVDLYGFITSFSEAQYWSIPDFVMAQIEAGGEPAGHTEVDQEDGVPTVRAVGVTFPVLVHEIVKGLMELTSRKGLPEDPEMLRKVIKKADLKDGETYQILLGRQLWNRFVEQIGVDDRELSMFLYDKIVSLPPKDFQRAMKVIQTGGPAAQAFVKSMIDEIKVDIQSQDRDDYTQNEAVKIVRSFIQ